MFISLTASSLQLGWEGAQGRSSGCLGLCTHPALPRRRIFPTKDPWGLLGFESFPSIWFCIFSILGNSLAAQWLRLCTSTARGMALIPGQETKIPCAAQHGQNIKKKNSWFYFFFLKILGPLVVRMVLPHRRCPVPSFEGRFGWSGSPNIINIDTISINNANYHLWNTYAGNADKPSTYINSFNRQNNLEGLLPLLSHYR